MKSLLISFVMLLLTGGLLFAAPGHLGSAEETEPDTEMVENSDSESEGIEGEDRVDVVDYLRILEEEKGEAEEDTNDPKEEHINN
ncbi:MAG: hypothetical protein JSW20_05525 [Nitrospiraceae bacterium]|nr:MAG: hypothetical protein JSW20_05525 [Nitrospiraceae bacterium]